MENTMELKIDAQARGVRIITGEQCKDRRKVLNQLIALAEAAGFAEITLPSIEPASVYTDKAGKEILGQMYEFPDKKNRQLCLRPEGTATIQLIADAHFRQQKNVRLWYFERCWRYERPQEGRYREFFQFGLEVLNPTSASIREELIDLAAKMIAVKTDAFEIANLVKRGLDYYTEDGFEISVPALGAQKQVVGGGRYPQGIGFGIGFDRLMLC
jgi:histidyl-tRNA synthetase